MIEFANPMVFLLLPLPVLVYLLAPAHRKEVSALRFPFFRQLASAAQLEPKPGSVVFTRTHIQNIAASLIWCLLIAGLAKPERVGEPIVQEKAARDVMLAIDISGSMDQFDFLNANGGRVQRLEAVKAVVGAFIEARDGDRVALIIFGTKAFVQAPFTEDLSSVRSLLDQTEVGMAGPHTVIGDAIGLSIKTFQASKIDEKLLILLSDGADTGSRMTPINAASIAAREGIEIITIGVGDPDGTGEQRVDVKALEDIASAAGGVFYFADDEEALGDIYARIDEQTPREVETISYRPRNSLSHYLFAAAALLGVLVLTGLHLSSRRHRSA